MFENERATVSFELRRGILTESPSRPTSTCAVVPNTLFAPTNIAPSWNETPKALKLFATLKVTAPVPVFSTSPPEVMPKEEKL